MSSSTPTVSVPPFFWASAGVAARPATAASGSMILSRREAMGVMVFLPEQAAFAASSRAHCRRGRAKPSTCWERGPPARSCSSGPRASSSLMIMSAQDAPVRKTKSMSGPEVRAPLRPEPLLQFAGDQLVGDARGMAVVRDQDRVGRLARGEVVDAHQLDAELAQLHD